MLLNYKAKFITIKLTARRFRTFGENSFLFVFRECHTLNSLEWLAPILCFKTISDKILT